MNIIDKHTDREYSALATDKGVVLCDKEGGAFLVLRSVKDLENLKTFLNNIQVYE